MAKKPPSPGVSSSGAPTMGEEQINPYLEKFRKGVIDHATLARRSCLSDPDTLKRMDAMAARVVAWHAPFKPIWYNMQDEGGLAAQNQRNEF